MMTVMAKYLFRTKDILDICEPPAPTSTQEPPPIFSKLLPSEWSPLWVCHLQSLDTDTCGQLLMALYTAVVQGASIGDPTIMLPDANTVQVRHM